MSRELRFAPFYKTAWITGQHLGDTDRLAFYDAILAFCFDGDYPDFSDEETWPDLEQRELVEIAFLNLAPAMESSVKSIEGGSKGGRPKKVSGS